MIEVRGMKSFIKNITFQRRITLLITTLLCFLLVGCQSEEVLYSGETNYEYDDQIFFHGTHGIVSTKDGYYFFTSKRNLMFFDRESQKTVPVCSQVNCNHNNDSCDAYFKLRSGSEILYYDNQLYTTMYDVENYTHYLCGISLDGSKITRYCDLLKLEVPEDANHEDGYTINSGDIRELIIHRGYAYYIVPNNGNDRSELRKIRIKKDAEPEIIYTSEDVNYEITRMKGFEDHIYFQIYSYAVSDSQEPEVLTANLYDYNILSGNLSVCIEDSIRDYVPMSDKIYFLRNNGIYLYTFENSQSELIYEASTESILSYDGKCFYIDNVIDNMINDIPREISVYDESFKELDKIELDSSYSICSFGDKDYLFCTNTSDDGIWMEALDKSQIETGTYEWIMLE